MCWLQLEKEVANPYPGLKDSGAGYNKVKDSILMCEYYYNTVPDGDNKKENNGINVIAKLLCFK